MNLYSVTFKEVVGFQGEMRNYFCEKVGYKITYDAPGKCYWIQKGGERTWVHESNPAFGIPSLTSKPTVHKAA